MSGRVTSRSSGGAAVSIPTNNYFSGYMGSSGSWAVTPPASGYTILINTGGNTLTTTFASVGFSISAMGNSGCGVIITPPNASAVFEITASALLIAGTASDDAELRLWDGAQAFGFGGLNSSPTSPTVVQQTVVSGIYAGGTATAITISLQAGSAAAANVRVGNASDFGSNLPPVQWKVVQIT